MAKERITTVTEYLRYNFTEQERLVMGGELAEAHNKLADIEAEETVIKTQIKERRAGLAQKVGTLSRELSMGFTMRNVPCSLRYDTPNVGEVQYWRDDLQALVRTRPMTQSELQAELEFDKPVAVNGVAESAAAVDTFFDVPDDYTPGIVEEEPQPEPMPETASGFDPPAKRKSRKVAEVRA